MSRQLLTFTYIFLLTATALAQVKSASPVGTAASQKFDDVLAQIITAAENDHLESLLGKRDSDDVYPANSYFPKVTLPGFGKCRIRLKAEDSPISSNARKLTVEQVRENRAQLRDDRLPEYDCTLDRGQGLTPSLKRAYERLVELVKESTHLPATSYDNSMFKAEDHPGSGVFVGDRLTRFSTAAKSFWVGSPVAEDTVVRIEVWLHGETMGWAVDLSVHAPNFWTPH